MSVEKTSKEIHSLAAKLSPSLHLCGEKEVTQPNQPEEFSLRVQDAQDLLGVLPLSARIHKQLWEVKEIKDVDEREHAMDTLHLLDSGQTREERAS